MYSGDSGIKLIPKENVFNEQGLGSMSIKIETSIQNIIFKDD